MPRKPAGNSTTRAKKQAKRTIKRNEPLYVVKGSVRYSSGEPFVSGKVRAYDIDLRSEQLLGESGTGMDGDYKITYPTSKFLRQEKGSADIELRVYSGRRPKEVLRSQIIFNASTETEMDLVVDDGDNRALSEYEKLLGKVHPLLGKLNLAELEENEKHRDYSFLSGETGEPQERIGFLAQAHRLSATTKISPEIMYALLRQNIPPELSAMLVQSPDSIELALKTASRNNIISLLSDNKVKAVLNQIKKLAIDQAFEPPEKPGTYTVGDLLATTLKKKSDQRAFLEAYSNHGGTPEEFWKNLENNSAFKDKIDDLRFMSEAGAMTWNHVPLVQELQRRRSRGQISIARDLAQFDAQEWKEIIMGRGRRSIGFPPFIPGESNEEKATNYATILAYMLEDAYPTAAVAYRLVKDTTTGRKDLNTFFAKNVHADDAKFELARTYLEKYLADNEDAMEGVQNPDALKKQIKGIQRLFKLTHYYSEMGTLLKDGYESAYQIARMGKGTFLNRYQKKFGADRTLVIYEKAAQASATAKHLYVKYNSNSQISMPVLPAESPVETENAEGSNQPDNMAAAAPSDSAAIIKDIPDWETLFGSLDYCDCKHCRSAYSPAAYLVDLLHFLKDRKLIDEIERDEDGNITEVIFQDDKTAKNALFGRRPDLGEIELSCENTNTTLPYIDLVNEILEEAVSPAAPSTPFPLDAALESNLNEGIVTEVLQNAFTPALAASAVITTESPDENWKIQDAAFTYTIKKENSTLKVVARSRQTSGTVEALLANPQYINSDAYAVLREALFPLTLPFDLWTEEVRTYLGHLGVQRHELMRVFQKGGTSPQPSELDIAAEQLGLTAAEHAIIRNDPVLTEPWKFWGLQEQGNTIPNEENPVGWVEALLWVRVLLDRSQLSYQELNDLLKTKFVNPDGNIKIKSGDEEDPFTCNTQKLKIIGLDANAAHRLHRFVRLWRKLGWEVADLDSAIAVLQDGVVLNDRLNANLIIQLAHIQSLLSRLNLPLEELLTFWGNISTESDDSLYHRLFQNPAVTNPVDPKFKIEKVKVDSSNQKITDNAATILASLPVTQSELQYLMNDIEQALKDALDPDLQEAIQIPDELTLAGLSKLYRIIKLAGALRLSMRDTRTLIELTGINPFDPANTQNTLDLVEVVAKLREAGISVTELDYLLRHQKRDGTTLEPSEETIARTLGVCRTGLHQIAETYVFNDTIQDRTGELTGQSLALLQWKDRLIAQIISIINDPISNDSPGDFIRRNMKTFHIPDYVSTTSVSSNDIPDFTEELSNKIYYEPSTEKLHFKGAMSEAERDLLKDLSSNGDYSDAIDELFDGPDSQLNDPASAFITETSDINYLVNPDNQANDKFRLILEKLIPHLRRRLSENLLSQLLSEALNLEIESVEKLLMEWINAVSDSSKNCIEDFLAPAFAESNPNVRIIPETFSDPFQSLIRLDKIATIISAFNIQPFELDWVFKAVTHSSFNLNDLPVELGGFPKEKFKQFDCLVNLLLLRDKLHNGALVLRDIFASDTTHNNILNQLVEHTGWDGAELTALTGSSGLDLTFPNNICDKKALSRVYDCFQMMKRLGVSTAQCFAWARPEMTSTDARGAIQAAKTRYEVDRWLTIAQPLRDELREKQRDALVAYLVVRPDADKHQHWQDVNDLYAHFLIDVEMSACQLTSRIKQALSSTQLFVQRCLMNLEPQVVVNSQIDSHWTHWEWMKNYRVWEANRKIFLYPENWIEPALRHDKSPFFKELENELLQNDITMETAETAFRHYLEKLDQVARLEIVGMYHEEETIPGHQGNERLVNVLHVFGRTREIPHIYFYRRRVDDSYWTPWERVDLDIEGDHLIPVVWNRRLYLFWPIFEEKQEKIPVTMPGAGEEVEEGEKYWEIRLAWSECKNDSWQAKRVTANSIRSVITPDENLEDKGIGLHLFKYRISSNGLFIWAISSNFEIINDPTYKRINSFHFTACDSGASIVKDSHTFLQLFNIPGLIQTRPQGMMLQEADIENGKLYLRGDTTNSIALQKTPGLSPYYILYAHQDAIANGISPYTVQTGQRPFFFQDETRTFFLTPMDIILPNDSVIDFLQNRDIVSHFYQGASPVVNLPNDSRFRMESTPIIQIPQVTQPNISTGLDALIRRKTSALLRRKRYRFHLHYHPYVCHFVKNLNRDGIGGLLQRSIQLKRAEFFNIYEPKSIVAQPGPLEDVDFSMYGAYSIYNWELFFHIPFLIASSLSQNQRFEEAQKWFHYIFDPTDASNEPAPQRFWRTRDFYERTRAGYAAQRIQELLNQLAEGESNGELKQQVARWRNNAFQPHMVARLRPVAYQKAVVMKYIDNLIDWGDQLFRRDTIESINEATQLYIMAAEILGRRPENIPPRHGQKPDTFNSLEARLQEGGFSDPLIEIENLVAESSNGTLSPTDDAEITLPLTFYLSKNDNLLRYWDTVADRLFKIRHCMSIEGVVRQLPLFEPPIDPALLVRAAALGVDLNSALNDMNAALPHYRFNVMLQKAVELCNDLRSLGGALLSALEKRDAEELSLLRSSQELQLLSAVNNIRNKQRNEAEESLEGLKRYRDVLQARIDHYSNKGLMNPWEWIHLGLLGSSLLIQLKKSFGETAAATAHTIGLLKIGAPTTAGVLTGGSNIGEALQAGADSLGSHVAWLNTSANLSATLGGYRQRKEEWDHQANIAKKEMNQLNKQLVAAEIRKEIAELELQNHETQIENANEVDEFMRNKFTNKELYQWMVNQVSSMYFQSYQLAYDIAKRAERAFRHELGLTDSNFIRFGYWDSLKKGLLAGEKLHHDLKRMETAYFDQNKREFELTKHVSLVMLNPEQLLKLRETGSCEFEIPEVFFDLDFPGQYMRRIKSVSITIPCVTGPYTNVNAKLTLLSNRIRRTTETSNGYAHTPEDLERDRFMHNVLGIKSIATSSAQNDSGMFEFNFRDERYLPFEGAGAISRWRLELPGEYHQFDYETISDVIIHLNYTARDGGTAFQEAASSYVQRILENSEGLFRMFSARQEFSSEWHRFLNPAGDSTAHSLIMNLNKDSFPLIVKGKDIEFDTAFLLLKMTGDSAYDDNNPIKFTFKREGGPEFTDQDFKLNGSSVEGLPYCIPFQELNSGHEPGKWTIELLESEPSNIEDIFVLLRYKIKSS